MAEQFVSLRQALIQGCAAGQPAAVRAEALKVLANLSEAEANIPLMRRFVHENREFEASLAEEEVDDVTDQARRMLISRLSGAECGAE